VGKPLTTTLDRMKTYEALRAMLASGSSTSVAALTRRLREAGCAVPSRTTIVRWAQEQTSPLTGKHVFAPRPSKELSFFLGAWLGDGWADESDGGKRMLLKVRSYDFAKEFADCAAKILNKRDSYWVRRVTDKHGRWFLVKVTSFMLFDFVTKPFEELRAVIEPFPNWFLRGFYTAEGNPSVNISQRAGPKLGIAVDLSNSDLELMIFSQQLLVRLGYSPGKIRLAMPKGTVTNIAVARADGWIMTMSKQRGVQSFAAEVGFADSAKQTKLVNALTLMTLGARKAADAWIGAYKKVNREWIKM
jgi:intein-encoded DNA endonuclease-like protein